ncbi:GGDEF domain-containing protein [Prosthecomicrobium sp. N25]|uniref:GGDEF domain-containing protein n=1 Tax=Prosthecomicrobium sp. N25 TaxID=3129254 RepID=UPI0030783443
MADFTFYGLLDRFFPGSFKLKLFAVAFVGVHLPFIALLASTLGHTEGTPSPATLGAVVLAATAVATILTIAGIRAVLKPVSAATEALAAYESGRELTSLPLGFGDEAGRLLRSVDALTRTVEGLLIRQEEAAILDPLTGLRNRRGFDEALERTLERCPPESDIALIVVDIDHFKRVNDGYGHLAGDAALAAVGQMLAALAEAGVIAGRYGGEEFLVFVPETNAVAADYLAERIRAAAADLAFEAFPDLRITVSAGVATARAGETTFRCLYGRADRALYRAKREGRNRVAFAGLQPDQIVQPDEIDWADAVSLESPVLRIASARKGGGTA